jgi:DNA modification methylase
LLLTDPPYGGIISQAWDRVSNDAEHAKCLVDFMKKYSAFFGEGSPAYVFGGVGRYRNRAFYRFLADIEWETDWRLAHHITWAKKRAYGVQSNYLFTREEIAFLVLGNKGKPKVFNVPYLDVVRGYAGYNKAYPAKSEFKRRTSVWSDVTEILRGKQHPTEKPVELLKIPVSVHVPKGGWVLDAFAGSGSTGIAARELGCRFVLVEKEKKDVELILNRLGGVKREA